jgi:hypothetical protein
MNPKMTYGSSDTRRVKLEDIMRSDYIPMGAGRPARDTMIGSDDICNLSIALGTSSSVDGFLKLV